MDNHRANEGLERLSAAFRNHVELSADEGWFHLLALAWWCYLLWVTLGYLASPHPIAMGDIFLIAGIVSLALLSTAHAGIEAPDTEVMKTPSVETAFRELESFVAPPRALPRDSLAWSAQDLELYIAYARKQLGRR